MKRNSRGNVTGGGSDNSCPVSLDRVLGLSVLNGASLSSSNNGDIFYPAGCIVVRYNAEKNKQLSFYKSEKPISCVNVSANGKYLAAGSRGHQPTITIWDVSSGEQIVVLSGHKHGVGCVAFSPDGKYLVSAGFKHDRQLILWDWEDEKRLTTQKIGNKVHAINFHCSGKFFVSCGDRHLKWWNLFEVLDGEAVSLEGRAASTLEDQRNSVFMDVVCDGYIPSKPTLQSILEDSSSDIPGSSKTVFTISTTGVLCMFNESKIVEQYVQVEASTSYSLELFIAEGTAGLLVVGCANGTVYCYSPRNLECLSTLPFPAPLLERERATLHLQQTQAQLQAQTKSKGKNERNISSDTVNDTASAAPATNTNNNCNINMSVLYYPACHALRKIPGSVQSPVPKLCAVYADHSMFVWDISDIYNVSKTRSFQYHRSCVWDLHFIERWSPPTAVETTTTTTTREGKRVEGFENGGGVTAHPPLPIGSFITCSADNTVKVWNTDAKSQRTSKFHSLYSREMLCSLDLTSSSSSSSSSIADAANRGRGGSDGEGAGEGEEGVAEADISAMTASTASGHSILHGKSTTNTPSAISPRFHAAAAAGGGTGHGHVHGYGPDGDLDFDLCAGIQDPELPERMQSATAPRTMAVHPYGTHLACGDRTGLLRVFDIASMQVLYRAQAHAAEILTLSYSPVLFPSYTSDSAADAECGAGAGGGINGSVGGGGERGEVTWTAGGGSGSGSGSGSDGNAGAGDSSGESDIERGENDRGVNGVKAGGNSPLLMLASAGRDRLVHIFDASVSAGISRNNNKRPPRSGVNIAATTPAYYVPMDTLDNHSSSVTSVKFSSDGHRLISCGGDKMMVFSKVNGREITRFKSIQTPQGTINGLAVEATNKFAVTTGQDKRLNIWNVQIGKHMRAYKGPMITSELYKCDIDPSGMYVVVCAFDKTISIFDFFSGELVGQTSGHSELVTGVKFSPDGQHVISIGGDGCIMIWKLSKLLVNAMQERLIELFTSAQRRNEKAVTRSRQSMQEGSIKKQKPLLLNPHSPYPHPHPQQQQQQEQQQSAVFDARGPSSSSASFVPPYSGSGASGKGVQTGGSSMLPPPPPSAELELEQQQKQQQQQRNVGAAKGWGGGGLGGKKWAPKSGAVQEEYELFGRKINPNEVPSNRNKFTLEFTDTAREPRRLTTSELPEKILLSISDDKTNDNNSDDGDDEEDEDDDGTKLFTTAGATRAARATTSSAATAARSSTTTATEVEDNVKVIDIDAAGFANDDHNDDDGDDDIYEPDFEQLDGEIRSDSNNNNNNDKGEEDVEDKLLISNAQSKVDMLERTAQDLESWLENMLRGETKLDESVAIPSSSNDSNNNNNNSDRSSENPLSAAAAAKSEQKASVRSSKAQKSSPSLSTAVADTTKNNNNNQQEGEGEGGNQGGRLDQSLSSAFFKKLQHHHSSNGKKAETSERGHILLSKDEDVGRPRGDALLPPPPPNKGSDRNEGGGESVVVVPESVLLERKRRETAAAVAQMKERLRGMGVLHATINRRQQQQPPTYDELAKGGGKEVERGREEGEEAASSTASESEPDGLQVKRRIPPQQQRQRRVTRGNDDDDNDDNEGEREGRGSVIESVESLSSSASPAEIAAHLREKAANYRSVIRNLERAKRAAAESYNELVTLRASLSSAASLSSLHPTATTTAAPTAVSVTGTGVSGGKCGNHKAGGGERAEYEQGREEEEVDPLSESLAETEQLLSLFNASFSGLNLSDTASIMRRQQQTKIKQQQQQQRQQLFSGHLSEGDGELFAGATGGDRITAASLLGSSSDMSVGMGTGNGTSSSSGLELSMILEKYSDKLMDIVSEKMFAKMQLQQQEKQEQQQQQKRG